MTSSHADIAPDELALALQAAGPVPVPGDGQPLRAALVSTDEIAGVDVPTALLLTLVPGRPLACAAVPAAEARSAALVLRADWATIAEAVLQMQQVRPGAAGLPPVSRFTVDDRNIGGRWYGPLPPLDLAGLPALGALPRIDGASVVAQLRLTRSPVGDVAYSMTVEDGRVTAVTPGVAEAFEVYVAFPYERYLRVRAGDMFVADAIRDGDLGGDFGKLQMFSGLTQSPPFRAAYAQAFGSLRPLADLAAVLGGDAYAGAATTARCALGLPPGGASAVAPATDEHDIGPTGANAPVGGGERGR